MRSCRCLPARPGGHGAVPQSRPCQAGAVKLPLCPAVADVVFIFEDVIVPAVQGIRSKHVALETHAQMCGFVCIAAGTERVVGLHHAFEHAWGYEIISGLRAH